MPCSNGQRPGAVQLVAPPRPCVARRRAAPRRRRRENARGRGASGGLLGVGHADPGRDERLRGAASRPAHPHVPPARAPSPRGPRRGAAARHVWREGRRPARAAARRSQPGALRSARAGAGRGGLPHRGLPHLHRGRPRDRARRRCLERGGVVAGRRLVRRPPSRSEESSLHRRRTCLERSLARRTAARLARLARRLAPASRARHACAGA
mmetsp:Transcript_1418/g.4130  ORF Transcript_1418/g.4130 Transcript_1418/m.4130 type:complete len:210 (+) Transcript_1418:331-960(+)